MQVTLAALDERQAATSIPGGWGRGWGRVGQGAREGGAGGRGSGEG